MIIGSNRSFTRPKWKKPRSKIGEEAGRARSRGTNGARYQRNPHAAIYAAEPIRSRQNFLRNESNVGKSTVPLSDPPPAPMDNANVLALQRGLRTAGYTVAIVFVTFLGLRFVQIIFTQTMVPHRASVLLCFIHSGLDLEPLL